jgi:uncharacterized protein YjeT (DUF2065 family)|tara:strand:- start:109 stop:294 length:186 start_codon:yes stop_codon:yes gene_type:complete
MENSLLLALGLFLIMEGVLPALFPNRWRAYLLKLLEQPIQSIRTMGIVIVLLGTLFLFFCL